MIGGVQNKKSLPTLRLQGFNTFEMLSGGEKGIRTPGGFHLNGFQDRRIRPLCHLSGANVSV